MKNKIIGRAVYSAGLVILLAGGLGESAAAAEKKAPPVPADMDPVALISGKMVDELRGVLRHDIVQITVRAQNERHAGLEQSSVDELDKKWRAEREADDKPLISATLSNPLSVYLLRMQARSAGLYSEIFIMDDKGLNVGQSSITTDYWQGDEAKYQKTYLVSPDALFIDDPEWNDETKTWRSQVNMTIADSKSGSAIGATVFEINLTELKRRLGS